MKIAITGNIASGKTQVEIFLANKGYKVLDTDAVAHKLLNEDSVKKEIIKSFEPYDITENSEISRTKLGKIVFKDNDLKEKLESILHPKVAEKIKDFFEENKNEKLVFVSVPQLFEANMQNLFDKVILVYANDEIRINRLIQKRNFNKEDAKIRLDAQMTQAKKKELSDFYIENNSAIEDLEKNMSDLIMHLSH